MQRSLCGIMVLTVCGAVLFVGGGQLRAAVITFDDLAGNRGAIPDGYAGFTWGNFYYLNTMNYAGNPSGYQAGLVSSQNVAYNAWADPSFMSDGLFTFNSAYFTAAWNDGLSITVDGYLEGSLVQTDTFTVNSTGPTLRTFNWVGIDELRFSSFGGIDNPDYDGRGTHFVMDDFAYEVAGTKHTNPEPTALAIWGVLGGLGLLSARRRRKPVAPL